MTKPRTEEDRPWITCRPTGRLLKPAEVAERVGLSKTQLYVMIREDRFPPFIKIGKRCSRLPEAWLDTFIKMRVRIARESLERGPRAGPFGRPL